MKGLKVGFLPPLMRTSKRNHKLKFFFIGVALVILAIVFLWPHCHRILYRSRPAFFSSWLQNSTSFNAALELIYQATDKEGHIYTLKAQKGTENSSGVYELEKPVLIYELNQQEQIQLFSANGVYNHQQQKIYFMNGVEVIHSQGYNLKTPTAVVDIAHSLISGDEQVVGYSPNGFIRGAGFKVLDKGKHFVIDKPQLTQKNHEGD